MKNTIIKLISFASCVFMAGCAANSQDKNEDLQVQVLPVTELVAKDTTLHHLYIGDIQAVQNVEIRARVQGYLDKILVDEGQEVKKGQPLFLINDAEYKGEVAQAKAELKTARAEAKGAALHVERVRVLVDKKVYSPTELQVAQVQLEAANARVDRAQSAKANAELKLAQTYIRAPFDGLIDRIPHKVGSLVNEGTLLTTVSDYKAVYAYFNVSENEYLEFVRARQSDANPQNDEVELILADGSEYALGGKIETVEGEFDTGTGSIAFRARFPNPDKLLKHGSTGSIRLPYEITDALILPQKATFEIQDKNYVYVVDAQNLVKMRSFVPKTRFSHFYIVESGLEPGDKVVYEGVQGLREGMKIQPAYVQSNGNHADPGVMVSSEQLESDLN